MAKRVTHIPTLQEYARRRRVKRAEFLELSSCTDCDYFRSGLNVCLWGNNIKSVSSISSCPVTHRDLQSGYSDYNEF